jgi:hypothetical protein
MNKYFNSGNSVKTFRVGNEVHTILGYQTGKYPIGWMFTSVTRNFEESEETFEDVCVWRIDGINDVYVFVSSIYEESQRTLLDIVASSEFVRMIVKG